MTFTSVPTDNEVLRKIEAAVEFTLNGGHPMDAISDWMKDKKVGMSRMDAVLKDQYDYPHGLLKYCETCKTESDNGE